MSEQQPDALPSWVDRLGANQGATPPEAETALRRAVAEVMAVQDVTTAKNKDPMRFRGTLTMPSEEAFNRLRPLFEAVEHTPYMRKEGSLVAIRALPTVFGKGPRKISNTALWLLIATIVSVFVTSLYSSFDLINYVALKLGANTNSLWILCQQFKLSDFPQMVPTDAGLRDALISSVLFAVALLGILGTHEMGHYIVARRHKVYTSPPFFIPLPLLSPFGTMGAVIFMQEPAPNRKVQFDIGIAGPLAGLIIAIPVLYLGLRMSTVLSVTQFMSQFPAALRPYVLTSSEGQSLLYLGMKYLIFGRILPQGGVDVFISSVAFAAWGGLLVTALNLMPAGQLDGGHVIYGVFGEWARKLYWPVIAILGAMTIAGVLKEQGIIDLGFGWSGWGLLVVLIFFLMRDPAPVLDEITGLSPRRRLLGLGMVIIFILIFTPVPLVVNVPACPAPIPTAPPATQTAPVALMLLRGLFV